MAPMIYTNGIDVDTGDYAVPPMSVDEWDALIRGEEIPENISELRARAAKPKSLGVKDGVEVRDLAETGWAVIFASDADPQVEKALGPLLELRQEQAGKRFHRYEYMAGESKDRFLSRQGAGPGPADPDVVSYYLLIVGSPHEIPYRFQSQLDVQHAVGRIHFDDIAAYATYAGSVVEAESKRVKLPRRGTFFGVTHEKSDTATDQSLKYLIDPLAKALGAIEGWTLGSVRGADAKKNVLQSHLGGSQTPALLFTASHGLQVLAKGKHKLSQAEYQGALICADWPGRGTSFEEEAFFFSGNDLAQDANLLGLIALFFACFGGGTPREDVYTRLQRIRLGQQPGPAIQLAPQPFIANLPRRMLSAPSGGALAVVGHVERTWPSSYLWKAKPDGSLPPQTATFESTLKQLMNGYPVGAAVEFLNQKYAELATMLKDYLEDIQFGASYDQVEFANVWMAANDAQWYTIIGDPAVRLPVVDETEALPRPVLVSAAATATDFSVISQGTQTSPDSTETGVSTPTSPGTDPADPRFAHPYTPAPAPTQELAELQAQHPELYNAYVEHVKEGYAKNTRLFDDVRRAFLRSHYSTVVMYWILFTIGAGTVIAGIVLALQGSPVTGAVFLGVGVAAFVTYFISRSILSVEENLIYITWLGVIYNSYWTHLAWATQRDTAQSELAKATTDAIVQLNRLLDRHARSARRRPGFGRFTSPPVTPEPSADPNTATSADT